tara:strand:+ start:47 stop:931 length:885 start_codon:yes stop_codon:yes gene_type:complete
VFSREVYVDNTIANNKVKIILLGTAQDGGVPHVGCLCNNCQIARTDCTLQQYVTSIGIVDFTAGKSWLVDCTPDFGHQMDVLFQFAPDCDLSGLLITHAHIGHYLGLAQLGAEVMNANLMPVYVSESMSEFLSCNAPWRQLVEQRNIDVVIIESDGTTKLSPAISIKPVLVPHRKDFTDTFAFIIHGIKHSMFYCPDIDNWDDWEYDLSVFINKFNVALLDGTFYEDGELPDRDMSAVSHPLVSDTLKRLGDTNCDVRFVHLNHTNPLLRKDYAYRMYKKYGVKVGNIGDSWSL